MTIILSFLRIIESNRLDGVVSMPSGVFKPYAGVSTAVLLFTRSGTTDKIWFYDREHDRFSLDEKWQPMAESVTIERLLKLEQVMVVEVRELVEKLLE